MGAQRSQGLEGDVEEDLGGWWVGVLEVTAEDGAHYTQHPERLEARVIV